MVLHRRERGGEGRNTVLVWLERFCGRPLEGQLLYIDVQRRRRLLSAELEHGE